MMDLGDFFLRWDLRVPYPRGSEEGRVRKNKSKTPRVGQALDTILDVLLS